jgi:hypothetical protein
MGSHPTLDHQELAAEALELEPDDWSHSQAVAHLTAEHPQVRSWPDGNPDLAHELDHRDWSYDHYHRMAERTGEQAFDRLNPDFGVPADRSHPIGHRDLAQREAALALGVRVAVHDSRQNDPNPIVWQPGQDYRMANAFHVARTQPTRTRHGPERVGPRTLNQHAQGAPVMAADNHTTIVGNLVEDPEVRFTNNSIAVTNLRVAVTQRVQQDGQWRDGETSFFKVNVWRGQAENLAESLGKGDRVMVTGRLRQPSWKPTRSAPP